MKTTHGWCPAVAQRRVGPPPGPPSGSTQLRSSKLVAVAEDWAPCCHGLVRVSLYQLGDVWRCCVWGADDTGREWDGDEAGARQRFDRIQHLVTVADLESWGFRRA